MPCFKAGNCEGYWGNPKCLATHSNPKLNSDASKPSSEKSRTPVVTRSKGRYGNESTGHDTSQKISITQVTPQGKQELIRKYLQTQAVSRSEPRSMKQATISLDHGKVPNQSNTLRKNSQVQSEISFPTEDKESTLKTDSKSEPQCEKQPSLETETSLPLITPRKNSQTPSKSPFRTDDEESILKENSKAQKQLLSIQKETIKNNNLMITKKDKEIKELVEKCKKLSEDKGRLEKEIKTVTNKNLDIRDKLRTHLEVCPTNGSSTGSILTNKTVARSGLQESNVNTEEVTSLKKLISEYEARNKNLVADLMEKERTNTHLCDHLDNVKNINKQLEMELGRRAQEKPVSKIINAPDRTEHDYENEITSVQTINTHPNEIFIEQQTDMIDIQNLGKITETTSSSKQSDSSPSSSSKKTEENAAEENTSLNKPKQNSPNKDKCKSCGKQKCDKGKWCATYVTRFKDNKTVKSTGKNDKENSNKNNNNYSDVRDSTTRLCFHFMKGYCRYGDRCRFKHGDTEDGCSSSYARPTECFNFKNGYCKFGKNCNYDHIDNENIPHFFNTFKTSEQSKKKETKESNNLPKNDQGMEVEVASQLQKAIVGALQKIIVDIKQ